MTATLLRVKTMMNIVRFLETLWQDLRYGLRMIASNRGFTIVAVLTLGLGIGANTAIFSLINKALLRPLPIAEPERVVAVNGASSATRSMAASSFSYPNYRDLRDRNQMMEGLIAYEPVPASLSYDGINERIWGYLVSGNYFSILGAQPALGRLISEEDDRAPGAHPVAVVSYRCWQQRFGGDPNLPGRGVIVNGRSFTIIGVAPPQFIGLEVSYVPEIWFPLMMRSEIRSGVQSASGSGRRWMEDRGRSSLYVAGRLKPGVSREQAEAAMATIAAGLEREYPEENQGRTVTLSSAGLWGGMGQVFMLGFSGALMGITGLLLLLVCTNLANLLLARSIDRKKEIAVRLALGASRARIVRQLLTESVLLSSLGSIFGLWLAFQLVEIPGRFKLPMALSFALDIDTRVLVFAVIVTFLTGAAFGLLPAWQATKQDLVPALKDERSSFGYRHSRLRGAMVAAQVALSLVLMIAAGLGLRALERSQSVRLGLNPQRAVKASFDLTLQGYDRERGREFQKQLLERVRALPGIEAAGISDFVPPDLHGMGFIGVIVEGDAAARSGEVRRAGSALISPGYLQALGTRLIKGRDFSEQDDEGSVRVAIVNESFARRFFPGEEAVGKRFSVASGGARSSASPPIEVIGVVEDGKYRNLSEEQLSFAFMPIRQSYSGLATIVARTTGETAGAIAAIRRELQQLDPHLPVFDERTMAEHLESSLLIPRIIASLLGGFGALSLVLSAVGIFGVMSYTVSRRTHEIGVRMALGAQAGDILRLLMKQGMTTVAIGLAIGLGAALLLTRLMASLLFGLSPTDLIAFAGGALLLVAVAITACYLPARRATRVDPMAALRCE